MINDWQLAQLNIATALYPSDDQRMAGFYSQLDDVNALAARKQWFIRPEGAFQVLWWVPVGHQSL